MVTDRTLRESDTDQQPPHRRQIFSRHECIHLYQLCSNKKVAIALLACIGLIILKEQRIITHVVTRCSFEYENEFIFKNDEITNLNVFDFEDHLSNIHNEIDSQTKICLRITNMTNETFRNTELNIFETKFNDFLMLSKTVNKFESDLPFLYNEINRRADILYSDNHTDFWILRRTMAFLKGITDEFYLALKDTDLHKCITNSSHIPTFKDTLDESSDKLGNNINEYKQIIDESHMSPSRAIIANETFKTLDIYLENIKEIVHETVQVLREINRINVPGYSSGMIGANETFKILIVHTEIVEESTNVTYTGEWKPDGIEDDKYLTLLINTRLIVTHKLSPTKANQIRKYTPSSMIYKMKMLINLYRLMRALDEAYSALYHMNSIDVSKLSITNNDCVNAPGFSFNLFLNYIYEMKFYGPLVYFLKSKENAFKQGFVIAQIPSGILSYVYPAHNIFGISVALSSIFYLLIILSWCFENVYQINVSIILVIRTCHGLAVGMAVPACHGIIEHLAPTHKRPLLTSIVLLGVFITFIHDPLITVVLGYVAKGLINYTTTLAYINVLYFYNFYDIDILESTETRIIFALGFMGIAWFVLWSYLYSQIRPRCVYSNIRRPNEVRSSHETNISTITQKLIDIPWTKLCTSMPVYAIVVSNIIDSWSSAFQYILEAINERIDDKFFFEKSVNAFTIIIILFNFGISRVEYRPVANFFSTTNMRKSLCSVYFISRAISLCVLYFDLSQFRNEIYSVFYGSSIILCHFGFNVNHLDIAPRYATILFGIANFTYYISGKIALYIIERILTHKILSMNGICLLVAVIQTAGAIFFCIFASADLQPWAEPQQNNERQRVVDTIQLRDAQAS